MSVNYLAKRTTRTAYTILAALLLGDGDWVSRRSLAASLFPWPISPQNLSRHISSLRAFGVTTIERRWHRGYRLTGLPPDEHLEMLLAMVPTVRRSRWWQERTASDAAA